MLLLLFILLLLLFGNKIGDLERCNGPYFVHVTFSFLLPFTMQKIETVILT